MAVACTNVITVAAFLGKGPGKTALAWVSTRPLSAPPSVTDLYCAVLVVNTCLLMSLNGCKEAQADACLSDWPCQGALSCVFSSIGHDITLAGHVVSDVCSQVQHYVQNTLSDAPATSPKKQGGVFSSRSAVR